MFIKKYYFIWEIVITLFTKYGKNQIHQYFWGWVGFKSTLVTHPLDYAFES